MFRKTLTIFSLIGLLLSVELWGLSYFSLSYTWNVPQRTLQLRRGGLPELSLDLRRK